MDINKKPFILNFSHCTSTLKVFATVQESHMGSAPYEEGSRSDSKKQT